MKTIGLGILMFVAVLSMRGAVLSESEVSPATLKGVFSEKYGCKIDSDGDLAVNAEGKKFIFVKPKIKMVRFSQSYNAYNERTLDEMIRLANKFNDKKIFLRVSIDPTSGSSRCDYYLTYMGGLETKNLLETMDWFVKLCSAWENFVIKNGQE